MITLNVCIFIKSCCSQKSKSCSHNSTLFSLEKMVSLLFTLSNYWISMLCWDNTKNSSLFFFIISNAIKYKTVSFHLQIFFIQRQDHLGGIFVCLFIYLFVYLNSFISLFLLMLVIQCHLFFTSSFAYLLVWMKGEKWVLIFLGESTFLV